MLYFDLKENFLIMNKISVSIDDKVTLRHSAQIEQGKHFLLIYLHVLSRCIEVIVISAQFINLPSQPSEKIEMMPVSRLARGRPSSGCFQLSQRKFSERAALHLGQNCVPRKLSFRNASHSLHQHRFLQQQPWLSTNKKNTRCLTAKNNARCVFKEP